MVPFHIGFPLPQAFPRGPPSCLEQRRANAAALQLLPSLFRLRDCYVGLLLRTFPRFELPRPGHDRVPCRLPLLSQASDRFHAPVASSATTSMSPFGAVSSPWGLAVGRCPGLEWRDI